MAPRTRDSGEESVTPLELFFDLVFVLALTQCTALMADDPTWEGLAEGLLVLGVLWWAWVGYAWLTSVVDPEEGIVRLAMFARDGGAAVAALVRAGGLRRRRAAVRLAYAVVRAAHIVLFASRSRDDPSCAARSSAGGRAPRSGSACSSPPRLRRRHAAGRALGGRARARHAAARSSSASRAGRSCPRHFAERHGLIMIIALGESIVAIGVGRRAGGRRRRGRRRACWASRSPARCGGCTSTSSRWSPSGGWRTRRRGASATRSRATPTATCTCRWWRGSCCWRSGLKKTLGHVGEPLKLMPATALSAAPRCTSSRTCVPPAQRPHVQPAAPHRARAAVALMPVAVELPALATLAIVAGALRGADRVRGDPLRRGARPHPPRGRAGHLVGQHRHRQARVAAEQHGPGDRGRPEPLAHLVERGVEGARRCGDRTAARAGRRRRRRGCRPRCRRA